VIEEGVRPALDGDDAEIASIQRPKCRKDCELTARPCPWVGCRYHLAIDVDPGTGAIKVNFPDVELEDMPETCALDIAEDGGCTLEEVARAMNITRERVRQIEQRAVAVLDAIGVRLTPFAAEPSEWPRHPLGGDEG
jgi:hypothetical protein